MKRDIGHVKFILITLFSILLIATFVFAINTEIFTTIYGNQHFNNIVVEDVSYVFNITVNNTWGGAGSADLFNITEVNITLPSGIVLNLPASSNTNAIGLFQNYSTGTLRWRNSTGGILINGSNNTKWFSFNATVSTPGRYNITALVYSPNGTNVTKYISVTVNDTTAPYEINVTGPTAYYNYSDSFVVNISVLDNWADGLGVQYVNITVLNSTVLQNATYRASNVSGDSWNITIDTNQFPDGVYAITFWANDTYGNINATINVSNVRFDNTAPTGSVSCTPNPVQSGDTITCSCSTADGGSGINSSATTITANPSTTNTGSFTSSCTFADLAGNTGSASTTYNVNLGGGSSGGGGGGSSSSSSYTKTVPATSKELKDLGTVIQELKAKERVKLTVNGETHYVGVKSISANSAEIEISSNPVIVNLDVGGETKVDTNEDGYYDVYVKLNSITDDKASVMVMYINEAVPAVVNEDVNANAEEEIYKSPPSEESSSGLLWLWVLVAVLVGAGVAVLVYKKKKKYY